MNALAITEFKREHSYLNNFHHEKSGLTNEHYFHACKTVDADARRIILAADSPAEAKQLGSARGFEQLSEQLGRKIVLREEWDNGLDIQVMEWGLRRKFGGDETLMLKLIGTAPAILIEGNRHHDCKWGVCVCPRCGGRGKNLLGFLLMELRAGARMELRQ